MELPRNQSTTIKDAGILGAVQWQWQWWLDPPRAKGTAALLVPLTNVLTTATDSWHAVLYVAAILNIMAAGMAMLVLEPMRIRTMARA